MNIKASLASPSMLQNKTDNIVTYAKSTSNTRLLARLSFSIIDCRQIDFFQGRPYSFTYGVKDDYSGTDFSRAEESSGQVTKGQYQVALPDGRIQVSHLSSRTSDAKLCVNNCRIYNLLALIQKLIIVLQKWSTFIVP